MYIQFCINYLTKWQWGWGEGCSFRFMAGEQVRKEHVAFHEPLLEQRVRTSLTRPAGTLSPRPTRGEGRGEGCAFGFMAGEQVRKEQVAFHDARQN